LIEETDESFQKFQGIVVEEGLSEDLVRFRIVGPYGSVSEEQ
jgi:hypothetical protein